MPELPEVETIVRDLRRIVVGRRIETVRIGLNKIVPTGPRKLVSFLKGETVDAAERRGKFILLGLSGEKVLIVHLKMTGQFLFGPARPGQPKHVHVTLGFTDQSALYYRDIRQFGRLYAMPAPEVEPFLTGRKLGPDPFRITPDEFVAMLSRRKGRIKPLLLNQRFIAGLGNIYVDESLFAAGIHPLCPSHEIGETRALRLYEVMLSILEEAIRLRGSSTRNYVGLRDVGGEYQNRHRVYGRGGRECPVCGDTITRMVVGGRGTCFCPCCQPGAR